MGHGSSSFLVHDTVIDQIGHLQGIVHATSRTGAKFEQETILFIHVQQQFEHVSPIMPCEPASPISTTAADSRNMIPHMHTPPHSRSASPAATKKPNLKIYRIVEFLDTVSIKAFFAQESERERNRKLQTSSSKSSSPSASSSSGTPTPSLTTSAPTHGDTWHGHTRRLFGARL
jgi:hypothetical protein